MNREPELDDWEIWAEIRYLDPSPQMPPVDPERRFRRVGYVLMGIVVVELVVGYFLFGVWR